MHKALTKSESVNEGFETLFRPERKIPSFLHQQTQYAGNSIRTFYKEPLIDFFPPRNSPNSADLRV